MSRRNTEDFKNECTKVLNQWINQKFGSNISNARLADMCGLDPRTVERIRKGKTKEMSFATFCRFAQGIGLLEGAPHRVIRLMQYSFDDHSHEDDDTTLQAREPQTDFC